MTNSIENRRKASRYPLVLRVELTDIVSAVEITARTSDVSRTGCYIDMASPLPRGSQVRIKLHNGREALETDAVVRYVSPGLGVGVEFSAPTDSEKLAMLDRWLSAAAKIPV
jgi:PilZ domain